MKIAALCIVLSIPFVSSIIGGEDKEHKPNHMFLASIQHHHKHLCCGVFVTPKFVLTASSCVKDKLSDYILVVANITDLRDNPLHTEHLRIDKIISKDPIGQKNVHDNIALLVLSEFAVIRVKESQYIRTIKLEDEGFKPEEGKDCIIYGWGTKSIVSSEPSRMLQVGSTEIALLTTCKEYNSDVDESNLCANNSEATLCTFDIGDPLISLWGNFLWGIATDEYACAGKSSDVFTRVDYHMDWILRTIDENSSTRHRPRAIIIGTAIIVLLIHFA
ncbi:serine protease ami-like [Bradysia coprophila]|uniref:serine protease ami-like n=1 Tax=Bradysia coprophila TaxID=38358 RepID=UPI00187D838E|nr:serine protease ami-like [Bradysia coprophila]